MSDNTAVLSQTTAIAGDAGANDGEGDASGWLPSAEDVADILTAHTCVRRCFGQAGAAAGCCQVGERDFIIGPIPDAAALLERLSKRTGRDVTYDEVFIEFDEGHALHPDKDCWQSEKNYPAIRLNYDDPRLTCRFLGADNLCTIYEVRSDTCRNYKCAHLKSVLESL